MAFETLGFGGGKPHRGGSRRKAIGFFGKTIFDLRRTDAGYEWADSPGDAGRDAGPEALRTASAIQNVNELPFSTSDSTRISPLCASTINLATASPRPYPAERS